MRCPADGAHAEIVETLPNGARIGTYRIERVLGEGGMGFVYEATHVTLNRRSAIKMLRPELATHEQIVTRFLNEAKAVNLIGHQNVVNIYDYGDSDGGVYFVMEFLEGETLDDVMRKRRPMALPLLLHVFGQIARALAAAHGKQIVHRDLKPANVFVVAREDNPYFIKLLDFGIAQLRGAGAVPGLTLAGSVLGTPQYMSPEQISGGSVDARSDVWGLGVMLYRAATGYAPFQGEEFAELAGKILNGAPRPAGEIAALPAALSALIASCLERRVEDRCPSVGDLIAGLERVKRECKLDDDAILAAVKADSGALVEVPAPPRDPTRESLVGSLPRFQGAADHRARRPSGGRPRRSRLGWYLAIGAAVGALGSAAYVLAGRRADPDVVVDGAEGTTGAKRLAITGTRSIKDAILAGDAAGGRALAAQHLRDAIASGTLQQQGFAVDALARVRAPASAPLLYAALRESPAVRVKAAQALGELALPDAVPTLRNAFAESGDKLRIEIAAVLYRLGDKDARAPLERAIEDADPGMRLPAAIAMADAADDAGRAVLAGALADRPPGSETWRRAVGSLVKLGDANARKLLAGELARPEATRSVGAAELLARAGDTEARKFLERVAADREDARRGEAAAGLARLGDKGALAWVAEGLASSDAGERKLALAICGMLAAGAASHTGAIAKLATDDPDPGVRMTAEAVLLSL